MRTPCPASLTTRARLHDELAERAGKTRRDPIAHDAGPFDAACDVRWVDEQARSERLRDARDDSPEAARRGLRGARVRLRRTRRYPCLQREAGRRRARG